MHRSRLLAVALATSALCAIQTAYARAAVEGEQPAATANDDAANSDTAIVVTGTRIISGFQQPTPVTAVTSDDLIKANPSSVSQSLAQLPQFNGSSGPRQNNTNTIASASVGTVLNLRNIGGIRTLILQDGYRVPPNNPNGTVNVDVIPELLIKRVDVVTGGVSAVYGSDAVSGVANFIIDKDFTGVRGVVQTGISSSGDSPSHRFGIAAGLNFLGDRGHILLSYDQNKTAEIQRRDRPLTAGGYFFGSTNLANQGSAANPYSLFSNTGLSVFTDNEKVVFTALDPTNRNPLQYYDPTGNLRAFDPGLVIGPQAQVGGTAIPLPSNRTLLPGVKNDHFYGRLAFDVSPDFNVFVEGNYAKTFSKTNYATNFFVTNLYAGNPYLPAAVGATCNAIIGFFPAGTPCQTTLSGGFEFPLPYQEQRIKNYSVRAGFDGHIGDFKINGAYIHGNTKVNYSAFNEGLNRNYFAAVDAVVNPANGQIVCRVTLTNPTTAPGCIPLNPLISSVSQQQIDYITGTPSLSTATTTTNDFVLSVASEPFSTWAGPVAISVTAEYRDIKLIQSTNANPADYVTTGIRGISNASAFTVTNFGTTNGSYNVKEIGGEVLVPLATDVSWAHELSVSGAVRYADYSTSGGVTTWKVGGIYEPVPDIRLRVTRSRDIRAPNVNELFAGTNNAPQSIFDAGCNCSTASSPQRFTTIVSGGNRNLKPEKANTFTAGVVLQPGFAKQFQLSVDYYDVKISDAIVTLQATQVIQDCVASGGTSTTCSQITRPSPLTFPISSTPNPANGATQVFAGPINAARLNTKGLDIEASFKTEIGNGGLALRLLANRVFKYEFQTVATLPVVSLAGRTDTPSGSNLDTGTPVPKWTGTFSATYTNGPFTLFAQERYIDSLKPGPQFVYNIPDLPSVWYTDLTASVKIPAKTGTLEVYGTINNLFNRQPPLFPSFAVPGNYYPTITGLYDVVGRYFTVGARLQF